MIEKEVNERREEMHRKYRIHALISYTLAKFVHLMCSVR